MLDDIKGALRNWGPPVPFFLGASVLIWSLPNNTAVNWPIFGEFVMDNAFKGVLISISWFLFFSIWIALKLLFPKYREAVYSDVVEMRDYLQIMKIITQDPKTCFDYMTKCSAMEHRMPKGSVRKSLNLINNKLQDIYGFLIRNHCIGNSSEGCLKKYSADVDELAKLINKFKRKTEWANNQ
jgi:hypothetical protein